MKQNRKIIRLLKKMKTLVQIDVALYSGWCFAERKQNATFKRDELSINHVEHNGYEKANYGTTNKQRYKNNAWFSRDNKRHSVMIIKE